MDMPDRVGKTGGKGGGVRGEKGEGEIEVRR